MCQAMKKWILLIILLVTSLTAFVAVSTPKTNWYDDFIFHDPGFTFQFIRTIGYSYEKGADIGESVATAKKITNGDFNSWYQSWLATAERIEAIADTAMQQQHSASAMGAYLRASNYYRTAGFYMVKPEDQNKSLKAYQKSRHDFHQALYSLPYIEAVEIPYEKTTLPGYLIRSKNKNAPIVIVHSGFDGTVEELYFEVGQALHDRGYNCLLIEGPGQGLVLRSQHLSFRPDWEKVIKPVVDFVQTIPNVDKNSIALMGISMGGYLAPRAAAFEPRIKALIANGGVYDLSEAVVRAIPKEIVALIDKNPKEFNQLIENEMNKNTTMRWFYENGMWSFHAKTPAEFMVKLREYNLKNVAQHIQAPTLVVDSEADAFMHGQARMLYQHLSSPKTFLEFTRREAAESHCQMSATAISNELILDWLDKTFSRRDA
jgi:alpha-beta hydrolase superfamily lysophospholipase